MANPETSVQALATSLPYEVNLIDWLEFQAHLQGFVISEVTSGDTAFGQTVHAAGRGGDGACLRLLAKGNGPHVVLLVGRMPADESAMCWETLGLAAASFEFSGPCNLKTREPLEAFTDRDGLFRVLYPKSWSFDTEDSLRPQKAGANFRTVTESETTAYLRVEADARISLDATGMEQLFQLTLAEAGEAGVRVKQLDPLPPGNGGRERERWLGECMLPSGPGQIALLFRPGPFCWFSAVMLCPDRARNPLAWMRAKRFYEIAVASLGPVEDSPPQSVA
jgi:hypothetical protein